MSNNKLIFRYGTMGAGKSMFLLATAHNYQERGIPFLILKPLIDTRDGDNVIHSRSLPDRECLSVDSDVNLYELISRIIKDKLVFCQSPLKWILVDECQFLTSQQVDELAKVVDTYDLGVICYGLRTDFKTKLFPGSKRLFEVADTIEEIKSMCFCDRKTIFNARIDENGNVITDGSQIEIGGDERYTSMCRKCYYESIKNNEKK